MADILTLEKEGAEAAKALPALLADAKTLAASFIAGAHGRRRAGIGETFWQYRDYTSSDPATAIDWRQSARSPNRLYIRETEWETAATIGLWCDGGTSFDYGAAPAPKKRWRGQVMAVAIALLLTRGGERIQPLPAIGPARGGHGAVMALADSLLRQQGETLGRPPLPVPGMTQTLYISDFYIPITTLIKRIEAMAAAGRPCHFVQISDATEESFPFAGRTRFESPDTPQEHYLFGDAASVQDAYLERRAAHQAAFQDACRKYGFTLLAHVTDRPAAPTLAALHHAVSGEM